MRAVGVHGNHGVIYAMDTPDGVRYECDGCGADVHQAAAEAMRALNEATGGHSFVAATSLPEPLARMVTESTP